MADTPGRKPTRTLPQCPAACEHPSTEQGVSSALWADHLSSLCGGSSSSSGALRWPWHCGTPQHWPTSRIRCVARHCFERKPFRPRINQLLRIFLKSAGSTKGNFDVWWCAVICVVTCGDDMVTMANGGHVVHSPATWFWSHSRLL